MFVSLYNTYSHQAEKLQSVSVQDKFYCGRFHREGCYHVGELYTTGNSIDHARV